MIRGEQIIKNIFHLERNHLKKFSRSDASQRSRVLNEYKYVVLGENPRF